MSDKERLETIKQTINHPNYTEHNGQEEIYFMVSDNDFNWLIKQAERVEELEKQLEQVKKASDFLLFQIGLARSESLIKVEFSGEEELYKVLEGKK